MSAFSAFHRPDLRHGFSRRHAGLILLGALALAGTGLTACRTHDFTGYPANYREFAYVSNGGDNTVSVFDVVNLRLDRQLQVGQNPTGVAANPKRNEVYVVNSGIATSNPNKPSSQGKPGVLARNGSVSVIDAQKNAVVANIPVHKQPFFIEVDPSGNWAYVPNSGSNSVSILDLNQHREVAVIPTGNGPGLARVTPDGKSLIVTNRTGNSVSIIDLTNKNGTPYVRKIIDGCPGATDAVFTQDSQKAFIACSAGHQVMVVALAHTPDSNSDKPDKFPARPDSLEAMLDVGRSPVHLAVKPDGGEVFVSNYDSDSISEIVTSTNDVSGTYLMGSHPVRSLVSPDNSLLFVSDFSSQELSIYSIDDGKRTAKPIHVGDGPDALAFSSRGELLFAVDARSGDVAVIRLSSSSLFTLLPSGRQPNDIAMKSFKLP